MEHDRAITELRLEFERDTRELLVRVAAVAPVAPPQTCADLRAAPPFVPMHCPRKGHGAGALYVAGGCGCAGACVVAVAGAHAGPGIPVPSQPHSQLETLLTSPNPRSLAVAHARRVPSPVLQAVYEDRMQRTREELNKAREDEIRAIERRKSKHIAALVAAHEKAFADIKVFYNEITHSNLELIKNRKDQLERLQLEEAEHERSMFAIAQENKRMSEPMQKAVEDVRRMTAERDHYRTDLADLEETKAHILVVTERLERLKWENEILEQRYLRLVGERDALYERFQHGACVLVVARRPAAPSRAFSPLPIVMHAPCTMLCPPPLQPSTTSSRRAASATCCWRSGWQLRRKRWSARTWP